MKKIISVLISTLLLGSCVTRQACERRFPIDRTDSISSSTNTVTVIRDTTIFVQIPGDTVFASIPLTDMPLLNAVQPLKPATGISLLGAVQPLKPATGISRLRTAWATSSVWIKDGKLNHRLEQRDTAMAATIKGAIKTSTSTTQNNRKQVTFQTRYTNLLTGWQWTQVYLGRVFLGVLAVIALWKVMNALR